MPCAWTDSEIYLREMSISCGSIRTEKLESNLIEYKEWKAASKAE